MPPPGFFWGQEKDLNGGRPQVTWFSAIEILLAAQRWSPASRAVTHALRSFSNARFFPMQSDPMPVFAAGSGAFRSSAAACGRILARKLR